MNLSKLKNKHFLSLTGNAVISLFGIATISLLSHFLSENDTGVWFIFLGVLAICDAVRNGFLNTATVKFYAGAELQRATAVLGSVWFLAIGITVIFMVANAFAFLLLPVINTREMDVLTRWVGLTFLSSLPYSVMFWKLQADENYGLIIWLRFLNNGSTILSFIILIILHRFTLESALLWNFLTNCLTSIVGIIWGNARLGTIVKRNYETTMELVHFGKYSLASTLSATLLRNVDLFIISSMLNPAALAVYGLPGRLLEVMELPLRSFAAIGMSEMAVAFNKKKMDEVGYILKKYSGMLTIAFIPLSIFAFFFADIIINLLYGHKWEGTETANVYRLFMIFCLTYPIDRFNGITLDIIHKPKINFYKVLIMLAVSVVADITGVGIAHNIYGIVFAGLFTNFSGLLFGYYHLHKQVPYTIPDTFRTGYYELKLVFRKILKLGAAS